MPTSETGTSTSSPGRGARRRSRGFTLMEIMVVVAIVGLVTAVVMVQFAGSKRDTELDKEAQRLEALFDYVREQAELQTRDYGFRINGEGYSFVVFDVMSDQWRPVEEDEALRDREFPPEIEPRLVVDRRTIVLDSKKKTDKELDDFAPELIIFANGDLSSFELTLQRGDNANRARLYSDEQSIIRMLLPGEVEEKAPPVRAANR